MTIYTCPVCGKDLVEMCYPTFPTQYGVECFNCGYKEITHKDTINRIPFKNKKQNDKIEKLAKSLEKYCGIPCDMCQRYIPNDRTSSCCPISKCNSIDHWKEILERILNDEKD